MTKVIARWMTRQDFPFKGKLYFCHVSVNDNAREGTREGYVPKTFTVDREFLGIPGTVMGPIPNEKYPHFPQFQEIIFPIRTSIFNIIYK